MDSTVPTRDATKIRLLAAMAREMGLSDIAGEIERWIGCGSASASVPSCTSINMEENGESDFLLQAPGTSPMGGGAVAVLLIVLADALQPVVARALGPRLERMRSKRAETERAAAERDVDPADGPAPRAPLLKPYAGKPYICVHCGSLGAKRRAKGSFFIEVILWCCMFVPGLIYTIWRMGSSRFVCATCGSEDVVPIMTARGQQLVRQYQRVG